MNFILLLTLGRMLIVDASGEDVDSSSKVRSLSMPYCPDMFSSSIFSAFEIIGNCLLYFIAFLSMTAG